MFQKDLNRLLHPLRATTPRKIIKTDSGIDLVYNDNDVVRVPFVFGEGMTSSVVDGVLIITSPTGAGGGAAQCRAFDIAEEITKDTTSVLKTAVTIPLGLEIAVGDMLFAVNGGRALVMNINPDGATLDVQFLGVNAPAREVVRFTAPVSATEGILTAEQVSVLQENEANYIEFDHENYYLADVQHEKGYLTYTHTGHNSHDTFFIKCITITLSALSWVLYTRQVPNIPIPTADDVGKVVVVTGAGEFGFRTLN